VTPFNLTAQPASFDTACTTGNYRLADGRLQQIDSSPRWNVAADCMIQLWCTPDMPAQPGAQLCTLFCKTAAFDDAGELTAAARHLLSAVKARIVVAADSAAAAQS
jgi:hypothetical protein